MFFCFLQRTTKNDKNAPPKKDARAKHCFADQSYLIQSFIVYTLLWDIYTYSITSSFSVLSTQSRGALTSLNVHVLSGCFGKFCNSYHWIVFFTVVILWSGFPNTVTLHWEADNLKRLLVCIHPSCRRAFVSSTPNEWSKALSCLCSLELWVVFLRTTCGQPWQFHLWLLSHRTGQIFRPVEGFDRTLSSNGTVQYFHSNNTEMMKQVEFELFQWLYHLAMHRAPL